ARAVVGDGDWHDVRGLETSLASSAVMELDVWAQRRPQCQNCTESSANGSNLSAHRLTRRRRRYGSPKPETGLSAGFRCHALQPGGHRRKAARAQNSSAQLSPTRTSRGPTRPARAVQILQPRSLARGPHRGPHTAARIALIARTAWRNHAVPAWWSGREYPQ